MKFLITILLFLFCLSANGQNGLNETDPEQNNFEAIDFGLLDDAFSKAKVVGIGEATHGTHEFQRTYLELFKHLVLNHGFNTLFLEDEFSRCLEINEALKSSERDKIDITVLGNWPFATEEILDLMNWIFDYNSKHPSKPINLVGVDMQDAFHINQTLNRLLELSNLTGMELIKQGAISSEKDRIRQNKKLSSKERISFYKKQGSEVHSEHQFIYQHLIGQLEFNRLMVKHSKRTIRDLAMGKNVLAILDANPNSKGMFVAHNAHLAKVNFKRKNEIKNRTYAGGILDKYLGKQYFSIMQDFDSGCFMAYNHQGGSQKSISNFKKEEVCIEEGVENSFGSVLRFNADENSIYLIDELYIRLNLKNVKFHNIGSVFMPQKGNKNQTAQYFELIDTKFFDALIFFKTTNPTTLIKRK